MVIDHNSRRVKGIAISGNNPTAISASDFLECAIHTASATPKYIICARASISGAACSRINVIAKGSHNDVYHDALPARERPRYELPAKRLCSAPCASPHAPIAGHCGARIRLDVRYRCGRKHLPVINLRRAAKLEHFGPSQHRRQLSASITFIVLRCPPNGLLEASAL